MDSDSENDILTSNNAFTFQNMNMTVSAKGPNVTNVTSLSFRNNVPLSSMYMPRNMEHSRYASSVYDQRSIRSRREDSPMSVRSAYDFQPRNFNMSHYPRGMSSQRSVINGRSGSPMSMTSTTSVSAMDIAMAFKNTQFNRHDVKIISEAYNKFVKSKIRKKFERKRNLRLFLKGARRRSGGESGEQGSDSSISDDDCRSNKTSLYKGNISSSRSTKSDLISIRRTMQESNIYNDCSANFKQKSFKNMFSVDTGNLNSTACSISHNGPLQKDRFKSGFLLPSQRFNKTVASSTIPENVEKQPRNMYQKSAKENFAKNDVRGNNFMVTTDSEHEEIFAEASIRQKQHITEPLRKRSLEKDEETHTPHKKRNKLSPIKNIVGNHILNEDRNNDQSAKNQDEFIFAKPSFPIKKLANPKINEKLIAKSPHVNSIFEKNRIQEQNAAPSVQNTNTVQEKEQYQNKEGAETIDHSSTDVSMRPSFIKRKLFTQKLDVAENKVLSSDHENSPKTVYGAIQKEKHKARKLVTNQSCLSRDVLHDDNYLDLIHKIVPPDQMNSTNQPNRSDNQRISKDIDDKWDVTSVISTCNLDNASDTYTDEDIFQEKNNLKNNNNKNKKTANNSSVPKNKQECKVIIERAPAIQSLLLKDNTKCNPKQTEPSCSANVNKNNLKSCAKSFWDTDLESDIECHGTQQIINTRKVPSVPGNNLKAVDQQPKKVDSKKTTLPTANISLLNNSTASVYKFNNTSLSIKSHRTIKKKKCCDEDYQSNATLNPTQNKQPASKDASCLSYTTFVKNVKTHNTAQTAPDKTVKNVRNKRSCRTPKKNIENTLTIENKTTTSKIGANRSLRPRKTDTSSTVLDDEIPTKTRSKKQNANTGKGNNKQGDKTKPTVNSRKSDVSFTLNTDVKTKPVTPKKLETVNKSRERKSRPSNVSFSITSQCPVTRSRSASKSNEQQKTNRSRRQVNHNISVDKDTSENKLIIKTPNKREGNNGVINMVQDLKSNKSKVVRKR